MKTLFYLLLVLSGYQTEGLFIEYKAPFQEITVKGDSVFIQKDVAEYDNPVSSIPSSTKTFFYNSLLSRGEVKKLEKLVIKSGFFELKESYGAPADQRYYPYTLTVKIGTKTHSVEYRSNPSYEESPPAFKTIESHLNKLADKYSK